MKKRKIVTLIAGLIITGLFLFSACSNILSPSGGAAGQGNVRVSLSAGPSARTLVPSALDFDGYDFAFSNATYSHTFSVTKDGSFTFNVPVGNGYSLQVTAYTGIGESKVIAAEGGSTAPFAVGASTSVTVQLTGNLSGGATGTFSYSITYPAGAGIAKFILIGNDGDIDLLTGAVDTADGNGKANVLTVAAGWYGLELDLADGTGKIAYDDDIVVIYSDTTTFYGKSDKAVVFDTGDFKAPDGGSEPNETIVQRWPGDNGFVIAGCTGLLSDAVGTNYKTLDFTAVDGKIWKDVLKIAPQDDWYPPVTMAFTYPLEEGDYYLSMQVWVDGTGQVLWQETKNWGAPFSGFDSKTGGWYDITGSFHIEKSPITEDNPDGITYIGILAWDGNYYGNGLKNTTIYIRDLKLVRQSDGVTLLESASNSDVITHNDLALSRTTGLSLMEGDQRTISANKAVTWSVEPAGIVSVEGSEDGLSVIVTALTPGDATIKATSLEDSAEFKTVPVTVLVNDGSKKYIAMTSDDGPSSTTQEILDILAKHHVHATFFVVGNHVNAYPDAARAILAGGHELANHSLTHNAAYYDNTYPTYGGPYTPLTMEGYKQELIADQDIIKAVTGTTPVYFRPPYICPEENLRAASESIGLPLINCLMFNDWEAGISADQIYQNTIGEAWPWGIFNLHDFGGATPTIGALDRVLTNLEDEGYTIVSLGEMMDLKKVRYLPQGQLLWDLADLPADPDFPDKVVKAESITISPAASIVNLNVGDTYKLTATVLPADTTRNRVFWYSDNDSVATVDSSGMVTTWIKGSTKIRANADGQMSVITVNVAGSSDQWTDFDWPGSANMVSGAVGKVGSWEGYSNVMRIAMPAGLMPDYGTVAMYYELPYYGNYTLSMDVWVQKRTAEDIEVYWEGAANNSWPCVAEPDENGMNQVTINGNPTNTVKEGAWVHVTTPGSGIFSFPQGASIYILMRNGQEWGGDGLLDAVLYIKDLKLEADGQTVLTIPSGAYDPETAFDEEVIPSWEVFKAGGDDYVNPSGAQGELIDDFTDGLGVTYSNVYRLALPEGAPVPLQTVAMTYVLPATGSYSLSMDIWVEKRTYQDTVVSWEETNTWHCLSQNNEPVTEGTWIHVSTPNPGYLNIPAGEMIYLLVANVVMDGSNTPVLDDQGNMIMRDGIKDAVLYIRNLELTANGVTLISCPSKVVR